MKFKEVDWYQDVLEVGYKFDGQVKLSYNSHLLKILWTISYILSAQSKLVPNSIKKTKQTTTKVYISQLTKINTFSKIFEQRN